MNRQMKMKDKLKSEGWKYDSLLGIFYHEKHKGYTVRVIDEMIYLNKEITFDSVKELKKHFD